MSGLQLPDEAPVGGRPTAARLFAVNQTASYRWTLAEDLDGFVRAGISGIGLYRPKIEEVGEDEAIEIVRASGLTVSSLSWVGGFTGSDGAKVEEALYDAGEAVRFAAAVDASTVGVVSGGSGNHITKHARRLVVDALARLCDDAGELGVRLALHPLSATTSAGQSIVRDLDETLDIVDSVGRPNLGFVFDLAELGPDPSLAFRIPEVAPLVHVVRLSERRHQWPCRRYDGGPLTAAATYRAFADAGYQGCFEFDLWSRAGGGADYDLLLAACRSRFEAFGALDARAY